MKVITNINEILSKEIKLMNENVAIVKLPNDTGIETAKEAMMNLSEMFEESEATSEIAKFSPQKKDFIIETEIIKSSINGFHSGDTIYVKASLFAPLIVTEEYQLAMIRKESIALYKKNK